jgi:hypothetical protein
MNDSDRRHAVNSKGHVTSADVAQRVPGKRSRVEELYGADVHRASAGTAEVGTGGGRDRRLLEVMSPPAPNPGEVFEQATRGAPSPLPHRGEMEAVFGVDFSSVQAYLGRSAEMERLGARGAAIGERVAFGPSAPDRGLVAHELAHVVQDRRSGGPWGGGEAASRPGDPAEREASAIAAEVEQVLADGDGRGAAGTARLADRIQASTAGGERADHETEGDHARGDDASAGAATTGAAHDVPEAGADITHAGGANAGGANAGADAADAAKADAAKADAAKADAAKVDFVVGPAANKTRPAPSPAATNRSSVGADATTPSRAPGVEAMRVLDGLKPSNLTKVVREVDRSLISGTVAARSALIASAPTTPPAATMHDAAPAGAGSIAGAKGAGTPTSAVVVSAAPAGAPAVPAVPAAPAVTAAPVVTAATAALAPAAAVARGSAAGPASPAAPAAPVAPARRPTPPPTAGKVSAGPRPRVDLSAEASPLRVDRKRGAAARVLEDETAGAHLAATTAPPVRQLVPPAAPRAAPPPIAAAEVAVDEPRFLAEIPPAQRPAVEAAVAPAIAKRVANVQARVETACQRTEAEAVQLDTQHHAEQARLRAQAADARMHGDAQVAQAREASQVDTTRVQDQRQRAIDDHHARTQAQVATVVDTGEHEVDMSLGHTESDASNRLSSAQAQARAMIAAAHDRAAAARASAASASVMRDATGSPSLQDGDPGNGIVENAELDADALLAQVMCLIQDMLTAAQEENSERVVALRQQIADLLAASDIDIDTLIDRALIDLPVIARYYKAQIDQLMASVDTFVGRIDFGLDHDKDAYIVQQTRLLEASLAEHQGMLSDITQLSRYTSVDDLAADFGLHFDHDTAGDWRSTDKQVAALGAVLTERAFRDSAPDDRFEGVGFGDVFQDIMGPIVMNSVGGGDGAETNLVDPDDNVAEAHYQIDWFRNVTGRERTDGEIDIALGLDPHNLTNSLLHNVIHEFGHVFDNRAHQHGRVDTYAAERTGAIPEDAAMRDAMQFGQHTTEMGFLDADQSHEEFGDLFLNFVTGGFKNDDAGRQVSRWFESQLYGDTSETSIPQDDWGWVDLAGDHGPDSQWGTYEDRYFLAKRGEDYLEFVANYFGITVQELRDANPDGLQRGTWINIPGADRRIAR